MKMECKEKRKKLDFRRSGGYEKQAMEQGEGDSNERFLRILSLLVCYHGLDIKFK